MRCYKCGTQINQMVCKYCGFSFQKDCFVSVESSIKIDFRQINPQKLQDKKPMLLEKENKEEIWARYYEVMNEGKINSQR